jgi:hypothetical protein
MQGRVNSLAPRIFFMQPFLDAGSNQSHFVAKTVIANVYDCS